MNSKKFDRPGQDVGNIIQLEHVNLTVPDQALATTFYVGGLGLTRDPYVDFGSRNIWINAGHQQFHLPTANAQTLRGHVGLIVPSIDVLKASLKKVAKPLKDSRFSFAEKKNHVDVTCPYGNLIRCYSPTAQSMRLGIAYVELTVPSGAAEGISRFYRDVISTPASFTKGVATIHVGTNQTLRFRETKRPVPDYDGHHIAIYISDFSSPYNLLNERGLITEESDEHQYRFSSLIDPNDGSVLYELEHEVRSLYHPMYNRPLINRNAAQSFSNYTKGRDAFH